MVIAKEWYQPLNAYGEPYIRHLGLPAVWAFGCAFVSSGQTAGSGEVAECGSGMSCIVEGMLPVPLCWNVFPLLRC